MTKAKTRAQQIADANRVRTYYERKPDAAPAEVAKRLGVAASLVYNVRTRDGLSHSSNGSANGSPSKAKERAGVAKANGRKRAALTIVADLPADGSAVEVKLRGESRIVGTLRIVRDGVAYIRGNGKKAPERVLTWKAFEALFRSGLI